MLGLNGVLLRYGIFPTVDIASSGICREDRIISEQAIKRMWVLCKYLQTMEDHAAVAFLINLLKATKTNAQCFEVMKKGA